MSTKNKETRGRKPLPPEERREAQIRLWVTDAEKALIEQAAGDLAVGAWAREALLAKARRVVG